MNPGKYGQQLATKGPKTEAALTRHRNSKAKLFEDLRATPHGALGFDRPRTMQEGVGNCCEKCKKAWATAAKNARRRGQLPRKMQEGVGNCCDVACNLINIILAHESRQNGSHIGAGSSSAPSGGLLGSTLAGAKAMLVVLRCQILTKMQSETVPERL